jgi:hypothetical protein
VGLDGSSVLLRYKVHHFGRADADLAELKQLFATSFDANF